MDNTHAIRRLKERYNIHADDEYIASLKKYIKRNKKNMGEKASVKFIENKCNGFLYYVNLNDFGKFKTKKEILVIVDEQYNIKTAIPFNHLYIRLIHTIERKRKRNKNTQTEKFDNTLLSDFSLKGKIKRRLHDHYNIELSDDIWNNISNEEYIKNNSIIISTNKKICRRIMIEKREVFIITNYNNKILNIYPPSFVNNKELKIKNIMSNIKSNILADAIKKYNN